MAKNRPTIFEAYGQPKIMTAFVNKRLGGQAVDTVALRDVRPILTLAAKDAGDPQKGREDDIGDRPAVPLRMIQRAVDMAAVAGRVYQNHQGDGRPAEGVQRNEAFGRWGHACLS